MRNPYFWQSPGMIYQKIHIAWLRKLPVMVMYLLFLAVQVFFNFDIGRKSFYSGSNVFIVNYQLSHVKGNTAKASSNNIPKSKLRLNKRFQPPAVHDIIASVSYIPTLYATRVKMGFYNRKLYSPLVIIVHSRRGPPAVA